MPSIFRIIPNLIAVRLLLRAAAVPKIKSHPRKEMLGWSFLIAHMLFCSKESGHWLPSEAEKPSTDTQMLNFKYDYIDWPPGTSLHLHIWGFSKKRIGTTHVKKKWRFLNIYMWTLGFRDGRNMNNSDVTYFCFRVIKIGFERCIFLALRDFTRATVLGPHFGMKLRLCFHPLWWPLVANTELVCNFHTFSYRYKPI